MLNRGKEKTRPCFLKKKYFGLFEPFKKKREVPETIFDHIIIVPIGACWGVVGLVGTLGNGTAAIIEGLVRAGSCGKIKEEEAVSESLKDMESFAAMSVIGVAAAVAGPVIGLISLPTRGVATLVHAISKGKTVRDNLLEDTQINTECQKVLNESYTIEGYRGN